MGTVVPGFTINCQLLYFLAKYSLYQEFEYTNYMERWCNLSIFIAYRYFRNVMHGICEQSETYQVQRKENWMLL
jgi:hypothetical protein